MYYKSKVTKAIVGPSPNQKQRNTKSYGQAQTQNTQLWKSSGFVFKFDLLLHIPTSTKTGPTLIPQTEWARLPVRKKVLAQMWRDKSTGLEIFPPSTDFQLYLKSPSVYENSYSTLFSRVH